MKYDYSFFEAHSKTSLTLSAVNVLMVECALGTFFGYDQQELKKHFEIVFKSDVLDCETPSVVKSKGAYFKGGLSCAPLEKSLRTKLPEDFVQFYERFGECVIITRGMPVNVYSLDQMIEDFEDDPDIDIAEGRFFRFANFDGRAVYLGLRRDDLTNVWQVVLCSYDLLYSEMIGPQGRQHVVTSSFYDWLKHLIETNGYPDECAPRDVSMPYFSVIEKNECC
jgi:hypothetical protein